VEARLDHSNHTAAAIVLTNLSSTRNIAGTLRRIGLDVVQDCLSNLDTLAVLCPRQTGNTVFSR
jgi:hypothetical protein